MKNLFPKDKEERRNLKERNDWNPSLVGPIIWHTMYIIHLSILGTSTSTIYSTAATSPSSCYQPLKATPFSIIELDWLALFWPWCFIIGLTSIRPWTIQRYPKRGRSTFIFYNTLLFDALIPTPPFPLPTTTKPSATLCRVCCIISCNSIAPFNHRLHKLSADKSSACQSWLSFQNEEDKTTLVLLFV